MSRQHELGRDLHFAVGVVLEGREVGLVFVGVHLLPVPVVSCRDRKVEKGEAETRLHNGRHIRLAVAAQTHCKGPIHPGSLT